MGQQSTYNRVVELFKEYEYQNQPVIVNSINDGLYDELGLDSLAVVELVMLCEHEFKIIFDDDEIKLLKTVQDVVDVIERELLKEKYKDNK